ncbi:LysM peptidoglycan-binding domain-containing protein [Bacillus sp. EB01]|uniref:LysM peptidoglycan-binding domain-containing protein n=1 Tax=Bacillus sp. EB01 TaxID=1347086 RepID=UPI0005C5B7E0|nr:LysM peptidoglycan-binding domain-containing protein [Bacillus sp. EB01]
MSQENKSSLRFTLEESLWFRKGQEVDELVSISLSPDITVQESDGYISIRGALDLTGEYECNGDGPQEYDEAEPALRYVQSAAWREEGVWEFAHRFPVDITIPVNRIESIYDIDVIVDSFDYSFTERSCMKLTAELIISGIYAGEPEVKEEPEEIFLEAQLREYETEEELEEEYAAEEEEEEEEEEQEDEELVFEAEARRMPEENPDELATFSAFPFNPSFASYWNQAQSVAGRGEMQPGLAQPFQQPLAQPPVPQPQVQQQPGAAQYPEATQYQTGGQPGVTKYPEVNNQQGFQPEAAHEQAQQQDVISNSEDQQSAVDQMESEGAAQVEQPAAPVAETEEVEHESSSSPPVQKKKAKKNSMSLTEFFARRDEQERHAKLKVCIVQKGDSLDSLSDRYSVSVQNILRYNNLEINQDVFEGQVLYIPEAFAKK